MSYLEEAKKRQEIREEEKREEIIEAIKKAEKTLNLTDIRKAKKIILETDIKNLYDFIEEAFLSIRLLESKALEKPFADVKKYEFKLYNNTYYLEITIYEDMEHSCIFYKDDGKRMYERDIKHILELVNNWNKRWNRNLCEIRDASYEEKEDKERKEELQKMYIKNKSYKRETDSLLISLQKIKEQLEKEGIVVA